MGRPNYGVITKHRWLWPLVDVGAALLMMVRDTVMAREARREARNRRAVTKW